MKKILILFLLLFLINSENSFGVVYYMPNNSIIANQSKYVFNVDNPSPFNYNVIYYYVEFFIYSDDDKPIPGINVSINLTKAFNRFTLSDGTNRTFMNVYDITNFESYATTNKNGRFYMNVPMPGFYNVSYMEADIMKSFIIQNYVYLDEPGKYDFVFAYPIENYALKFYNATFVDTNFDKVISDGFVKFVIAFSLFSAMCIPLIILFVIYYSFKRW